MKQWLLFAAAFLPGSILAAPVLLGAGVELPRIPGGREPVLAREPDFIVQYDFAPAIEWDFNYGAEDSPITCRSTLTGYRLRSVTFIAPDLALCGGAAGGNTQYQTIYPEHFERTYKLLRQSYYPRIPRVAYRSNL